MTEPVRLSKRLIELVGCSRREADLFIEGGWVTVDGAVVDEPQFKILGQKVELLPGANAKPIDPVTMLLHQPGDFVGDEEALRQQLTPRTRWSEDSSGIRTLRGHFVRLSHSLPLQPSASGLMVFTQDWKILRKLTEDAARVEQEYVVEVSGEMRDNGLDRLQRGYGNDPSRPCKVSWQNETRLRFALKNPASGAIERMCDSVGLAIVSMKRIRVGGVPMGKISPGQWRYLGPSERF